MFEIFLEKLGNKILWMFMRGSSGVEKVKDFINHSIDVNILHINVLEYLCMVFHIVCVLYTTKNLLGFYYLK